MVESSTKRIRLLKKESLLRRAIAVILQELAVDVPLLSHIVVTRSSLSGDERACTIFFHTPLEKQETMELSKKIKSLTPRIRTMVLDHVKMRFVPKLTFAFDRQYKKQQRLAELFRKMKTE